MKKSIKNVMRRILVFVLTLCMIAPLVSPFSSAEAESTETIANMNDNTAYMIDLSQIPQGLHWCLGELKYSSGKDIEVAFDYYLTGTNSSSVRVQNYVASGMTDVTTNSEYLKAGTVTSFSYKGTCPSNGFMASIHINQATTQKLYIWNVNITCDGVSVFKAPATQYEADVKALDPTKVMQTMPFEQVPIPAYEIDFKDFSANAYWCLTNNNGTADYKISFDYYLSGTNVENSFSMYWINMGQSVADTSTGQTYLNANQVGHFTADRNFSADAWLAIRTTKQTDAKLYMWNVKIYRNDVNVFKGIDASQYHSEVKNLNKADVFKQITYQDVPRPAYMIDFTKVPLHDGYHFTDQHSIWNKAINISFNYYLANADDNTLRMVNHVNNNSAINDSTTGTNYLKAGEVTKFSCTSGEGLGNNLMVCLAKVKNNAAKLYIWDLVITVAGASCFNLNATQHHSGVANLDRTEVFKEMTVKDLPIPGSPRTTFDEGNIIARFGVISDIHLSGSWNQSRSRAKFAHAIDVLQRVAEDDGEQLDALLINGDLVDAVASGVNVQNKTQEGKNKENFYEANLFAQGLWGGTNGTSEYNAVKDNTTTGYGNGLSEDVQLLYSLGNHDETGEGIAHSSYTNPSTKETTVFDDVYAGYYFAAVICGWQNVGAYKTYITNVVDAYTGGTVDADTFNTTYGVTLDSAVEKFEQYYGHDLEGFNDTEGLFYGNRHMKIGDIDVVAIELSTSSTSVAFLREICEKSVAENPNKPIFVMTHKKTDSNILGGEEKPSNVTEFEALLKEYPQIIVWGGHSHSQLHSDAAIDTTNGYVAVDSGAVAYAAQAYLTRNTPSTKMTPVNAAAAENHSYGTGCYVEVDANYNVRIKRIDLYRSYSADYAANATLYSSAEFTKYQTSASCEPVSEAVFIREPWDITDINAYGKHLLDYTTDRGAKAGAPTLTSDAGITLTSTSDQIRAKFVLNGTVDNGDGDNDKADGLVYMYVVELRDSSGKVVDKMYYTNKFYDYQDPKDIPALSVNYVFDGLNKDETYTVKMYPVSEYGVAGEAKEMSTSMRGWSTDKFKDAYVIDFANASTQSYYTLTSVNYEANNISISFNYYMENAGANEIYMMDINDGVDFIPNNASDRYLQPGYHTYSYSGTTGCANKIIAIGMQTASTSNAKVYIWDVVIKVNGSTDIFKIDASQQCKKAVIPSMTTMCYEDMAFTTNDITGDFSTDVCDLIRMKKYDADDEKETFYMHKGNLEVEDSAGMRVYLCEN